MPHPAILDLWRQRMGEIPEPEKFGRLDSLNQISPAIVAAARRLSTPHKTAAFISSYLRPDRTMHVGWFVEDVVHGDVAPETWLRGKTWIPSWSFADQVTLPLDRLLAPISGPITVRLAPSLDSWGGCGLDVGAPCRLDPDADYLTPIPEHAQDYPIENETEPIGDLAVAVRRWIAARIAAVVRRELNTDFRHAQAIAAGFVPLCAWTEHAVHALSGLIREAQELGPELDNHPGFRGPDEWYLG